MDDFNLKLKWERNRCLYEEELWKLIANFFCKAATQIGSRQLRFEVYRSHEIRNTDGRSPLNAWSARRRGRYLHKTQQTQETNTHSLCEIRTRDPRNYTTEIGARYSVILYIISNYVTAEFVTYYIAYRTAWDRISGLLTL